MDLSKLICETPVLGGEMCGDKATHIVHGIDVAHWPEPNRLVDRPVCKDHLHHRLGDGRVTTLAA